MIFLTKNFGLERLLNRLNPVDQKNRTQDDQMFDTNFGE